MENVLAVFFAVDLFTMVLECLMSHGMPWLHENWRKIIRDAMGAIHHISCTLWLFNIAMENGPLIDDFPINTSIYKEFSMTMLKNQMFI